MGRIQDAFARLKKDRQKAYVGYVMAGYPSAEGAFSLGQELLKRGADMLEVGLPFSDPMADGVVIQRCGEVALAAGTTPALGLDLLRRLRAGTDKPLLVMTYYNLVLALGLEMFAHATRQAGADGLVVPDLPPEEAAGLAKACKSAGLDLVYLAAPTSTPQRLKAIAKAATGFIYVVSVAGVTGERAAFDKRLAQTVSALRKACSTPLVIGFGVSSPETAREAARLADGVVVASSVLKVIVESTDKTAGVAAALERANELIQATHQS